MQYILLKDVPIKAGQNIDRLLLNVDKIVDIRTMYSECNETPIKHIYDFIIDVGNDKEFVIHVGICVDVQRYKFEQISLNLLSHFLVAIEFLALNPKKAIFEIENVKDIVNHSVK